jgi:hypothetical protein
MSHAPMKLFCCDLNHVLIDDPVSGGTGWFPSAAHDWAHVDPQEYFDWHLEMGVNIIFCQAFTHSGYAFYPTRLGPVAPGRGADLLPQLLRLSREHGLPFCTYFNCTLDLALQNVRGSWVVPGSRTEESPHGFLAPEGPWCDLLCARIEEFLLAYPVEWINFDSFGYGSHRPDEFVIRPAPLIGGPFERIIGRRLPADAAEITPDENLRYKREVLAEFHASIRQAMHRGCPTTRAFFNVPFWRPAEPLWGDHPMIEQSEMLVAESSDDVVPWLLSIRKPGQRVMTTIMGRGGGLSSPGSWRRWYAQGCDFFAYAWGTPPDFRPSPRYAEELEIVRAAFHEMP